MTGQIVLKRQGAGIRWASGLEHLGTFLGNSEDLSYPHPFFFMAEKRKIFWHIFLAHVPPPHRTQQGGIVWLGGMVYSLVQLNQIFGNHNSI